MEEGAQEGGEAERTPFAEAIGHSDGQAVGEVVHGVGSEVEPALGTQPDAAGPRLELVILLMVVLVGVRVGEVKPDHPLTLRFLSQLDFKMSSLYQHEDSEASESSQPDPDTAVMRVSLGILGQEVWERVQEDL